MSWTSLTPSWCAAQAQWATNGVVLCTLPNCGGHDPMICSDGAGGAFILWHYDYNQGSGRDLFVNRILASGQPAPGWPPLGRLLCSNPSSQFVTDFVSDGQGGAYAVWVDYRSAGGATSWDLYAQRVLSDGQIAPGWPADGLPICVAPGEQDFARILADGEGGAFFVWNDARPGDAYRDIYAVRMTGSGTRSPGWPENGLPVCTDPLGSGIPALVADGQGGIIVAWSDSRNSKADEVDGRGEIFAVRMNGTGEVATGWNVNGNPIVVGPGHRNVYGLEPDGSGGAYVAVDHVDDLYTPNDVYASRVTADGQVAAGWPATGLPVVTLDWYQWHLTATADGAGGLYLAWADYGDDLGVVVQRLRPDGTRAPDWGESGIRVSDLPGFQGDPDLVADGLGGVYVTFESGGGSNRGYIQHLTAQGTLAPGWLPSGIPLTGIAGSQHRLRCTVDGSGGAIVAWEEFRDGNGDKIYAQRFSGDGPTPTQLSLVSSNAEPDLVTLTWHRAGGASSEAAVYRRTESVGWLPVDQTSFDASGMLRFEDRSVSPGRRYAYRLGIREDGGETFSAEVWVDVPVWLQLALDGLRPNPAVGELRVSLALPRYGRASLEFLDVSGRAVIQREVGNLGPGQHQVSLGDARDVAPGIYWLRLTTDERSLVTRAAVIR